MKKRYLHIFIHINRTVQTVDTGDSDFYETIFDGIIAVCILRGSAFTVIPSNELNPLAAYTLHTIKNNRLYPSVRIPEIKEYKIK